MYHYRPLPGITIVSNMRWRWSTLVIGTAVVAILIWLAMQSQSGINAVGSALHTVNAKSQRSHWPHQHHSNRSTMPQRTLSAPAAQRPPLLRPVAKRRRLRTKEKMHVLNRTGGRCAHCQMDLSSDPELIDYDHAQPLWTTALPWVDPDQAQSLAAYQPLCPNCHRKKTLAEFKSPLYKEYLRRRRKYRLPHHRTLQRAFGTTQNDDWSQLKWSIQAPSRCCLRNWE